MVANEEFEKREVVVRSAASDKTQGTVEQCDRVHSTTDSDPGRADEGVDYP